jgi:flavodoxin
MAADTSGKILVTYYSASGNTARIARDIARLTCADLESLRDFDHEGPLSFMGYAKAAIDALRGKPARIGGVTCDPRKYALVIIGTPVWAGHITPPVRAYLERYKDDLARVAFFVTSGNTSASKIVLPMEAIVGHKAEAFVGFDAVDLKDPRVCSDRIAGFLQALRRAPDAPDRPVAVSVC